MTDKLVSSGLVAVIISPGFGSGFATWNRDHFHDLLFDRQLALAVTRKDEAAFDKRIEEIYPEAYYHFDELEVDWVPVGEMFYINEYDGYETVIRQSDMLTA